MDQALNRTDAASISATILEEEEARREALEKAYADTVLPDDLLPGVGDEEMTFREGAQHGDHLEIRSHVSMDGPYRAIFDQQVWRPSGTRAMVEGLIQLVCVDRQHQLVRLPSQLAEALGTNVD